MVSIGTLFAFILVCGAVIYLRQSDAAAPPVPHARRADIPVLGILFCLR